MPKFSPSDDGKVIDGKVVVYIYPPTVSFDDNTTGQGPLGTSTRVTPALPRDGGTAKKSAAAAVKNATAAAQVKALTSAAKDAVPFCEECEKARKDLEKKKAADAAAE
jgi:hypothetical protein